MKKCFLVMFLALSAFGNPSQLVQKRVSEFEPCLNWWFDFEANAYNCRLKGARTRFFSASEVESLVNKLKSQIVELEKRVKFLEEK